MAISYNPMPVAATTFSSNTTTGGSVPASFDAFLYQPTSDSFLAPMKLTIAIRMKLRQSKSVPFILDADDKLFWTLPWPAVDWGRFVAAAQAQANMWNGQFWLVSPPSFSEYNKKVISMPKEWRPNVVCELSVDFAPSGDAHRTIDVAYLNLAMLTGQSLDSLTFRSHSLLYDSLDTIPHVDPVPQPGEPQTHHTIAHEIGHTIGLDHIGVMRRLPLCEFAIASANAGMDVYWKIKGGTNSHFCYGSEQGINNSGNIMGAGDDFSVENATPWLWAMGMLRPAGEIMGWRAVTSDPGAGTWT
ncbi:hypothetical protein GCM10007874_66080 [Labrys miyagiensis]|uniref:Peptidase M10 metallopeptidase domain-containing protein n=1 Tax=Labrys miyagiensis TaxID=346912 RepID=A0ABQ6CVE4_9HYPH|nr:hypothetical protein [Labrys miyagiensis]GLS23587.1 hypothetical protein GCM10007874_66080 [Labrys miyagiensis]